MLDIEKIYRLYFKDVFYFVLSLSKNEDVANEITSETFFKVLKSKEKLEDVNSIKSYIFKIAKNSFLDYIRKNNFENIDIENIELISENFNPEDEILKYEMDSEIKVAISKLDETDRNIVKLRAFQELSFSEIGQKFGKSENWACVRFHRAKEKLRNFMEEYYE